MENYQVFAAIYDDLMDKSLYLEWLKYVQERVAKGGSILELASGAGDLAQLLVENGFPVTVTDLSESMLEIASAKLSEQTNVDFLQLDMRDFSFAQKYAAVICFDDSICYLNNEEELRQTFINIYSSLENNGKFLFDCHSIYQMDTIFPNYMFNEINDDYTFVWRSFVGEKPHSVNHDLQIFLPTSKSTEPENQEVTYELFEEVHTERTYPLETYVKLLEEVGFIVSNVTSDFTDELDQKKGKRWFFECSKNEDGTR